MAILLSLCGVRVDVGLEPYLPPWREMILGPTSALTQTQFHNLRNRLEDGHGLHPKSVDLDGFFTARRLLGWVHSLDRLQVPQAELETWLVQREPDSLPVGFPDQTSPLVRATAELERHQTVPSVESRAALGNQQDEEEDEDKEVVIYILLSLYSRKCMSFSSLASEHLSSAFGQDLNHHIGLPTRCTELYTSILIFEIIFGKQSLNPKTYFSEFIHFEPMRKLCYAVEGAGLHLQSKQCRSNN